ncbi:interleukin-15 isoform X1 [Genypterus blacodes]|uniref:interleukin-15 isoform X1 n=1 Tax=Genypterus blacodes TaxID=154954 RepID=UPI003F776615
MTDLVTAMPQIRVRICLYKRRAKGVRLRQCYNICPGSHTTQVWLSFLILSVLSTSACAASLAITASLQTCLDGIKHTIERSDALLYSPSTDDIKASCRMMSLRCYMLELEVIFFEEDVEDKVVDCKWNFEETLPPIDASVDCPPCEAYARKNTTVFLSRLKDLLHQSLDL